MSDKGTIDLGHAVVKVTHGAVDVHTADVHHLAAIRKFHRDSGVASELAAPVTSNAVLLSLVSTTGFVAGDMISLGDDNLAGKHSRYGITLVSGNLLFLDRPVDLAMPAGEKVHVVIDTMHTPAGTVSTPVVYEIKPPADQQWHITRLIVSMTHSSAGDLGLFGNQAALTNGVQMRESVEGQMYNIINWKSNADIKSGFYDVEFDTRSGGGGTYGTSGRGSFYKLGMVVHLDGAIGDVMQVLIQDDLTGLLSFSITAQGHIL